MSKKTNNQTAKVNWPITILLIIGCLTVFFPLYMAVIIAFKQPSEMTNRRSTGISENLEFCELFGSDEGN